MTVVELQKSCHYFFILNLNQSYIPHQSPAYNLSASARNLRISKPPIAYTGPVCALVPAGGGLR